MEAFNRIVVRMPNWLGDVVMATPLVRTLREAQPRATIDLIVQRSGAAILDGLTIFDDVIHYDRNGVDSGLGGMWRVAQEVRRRRYDLAVCCPNSFSSALMLRMSGVPRRLGWSYGGRGFLLTDRLQPEMKGHRRKPRPMPQYYLDFARHLGCEILGDHAVMASTPEGDAEAAAYLAERGAAETPVVGLNVGASFGPSKHWRADRFGEVAAALHRDRGFRPMVLCGPGEEALGKVVEDAIVAAGVPTVLRTSSNILSLAGLKGIVKRLALMVTTDTGPRHFGIAFDVPTVCVMGSTSPNMTAQPNTRSEVVTLTPALECMPCHEKVCPLVHQRCLQDLQAAPVLAAVDRVLALPPRTATAPPDRTG